MADFSRIGRKKSWEYHKPETKKANAARGRKKLKNDVLTAYGAMCACCKETNTAFLTVDHIEGGGNQHRKQAGLRGSAFYRMLRQQNYPTGYQILCFNCNFGKWANGGVCPHVS